MSFISVPLPTSATCLCTVASVCFSFGRFSARPDVNLSHASFAAASESRASRRCGWIRTESAFSTSAEGIRPDELESLLHRLHRRRHGGADRDVVEHFAAQAVGDLRRALDDAADLQVDARGQLLHAEAGFETVLDEVRRAARRRSTRRRAGSVASSRPRCRRPRRASPSRLRRRRRRATKRADRADRGGAALPCTTRASPRESPAACRASARAGRGRDRRDRSAPPP